MCFATATPKYSQGIMIDSSFYSLMNNHPPTLTDNRVPAATSTGAQTWWQYSDNGEAAFIGKAVGGGAGGGSPQSAEAQQEPKTDCEQYAEALADHAAGYKGLSFGKNRFGLDLVNRANPLTGSIDRASFDLAPSWSGFKDELVNGGQKSGVYRHVSAALGSALSLGGGIFGLAVPAYYSITVDFTEHMLGDPEALAEMFGNRAGMLLVPGFNKFFNNKRDKESLINHITAVLCDK